MRAALIFLTLATVLAQEKPARTYSGIIRTLDTKSFDLQEKDTRVLTIQITAKTVKPDGLKAGDGVDVEAVEDKDGQFHALRIKLNPEITDDQAVSETRTPGPPTIVAPSGALYDEGDSGPPKLKRGVP